MSQQLFDIGPVRGLLPEERAGHEPSVPAFFKQTLDDQMRVANVAGGHIMNAIDAFDEIDDGFHRATGSRLPALDKFEPTAWNAEYSRLKTKHPDQLPWADSTEFEAEINKRALARTNAIRTRMTEMSQQADMLEATEVPVVGKIPYVGPFVGGIAAFGRNAVVHPQYTLAQLAANLIGSTSSLPDAAANAVGFWAGRPRDSILKAAFKNAASNAAIQAPLSAYKQLDYRDAGLPYGWDVWAAEVSGAGAAGFALDAGIRAPGRAYLRRYGRDVAPDEFASKNTVRGGVFRDAPEDLNLPKPPPVRDTSSITPEIIEKAQQNDPAALREIAEKTGAIEDPAVKGAIHHLELGGAVDDAIAKYLREKGIDTGEGLTHLVNAMTGRYDYLRSPDPIRPAAEPMLRDEGNALLARVEGQLAGIEPRVARGIVDGLEAGLPQIVRAVREAPERAPAAILEALAKVADDMGGEERLADLVAIHAARDPIAVAAAIRRNPDLIDSNVPLSTDFMRGARALAALDDGAFGMLGTVPHGVAAAVADLVPPGMHTRIMDDLRKAGAQTGQQARALIPDLMPVARSGNAPLDGGSRMSDPMGAEAKAQTERLLAEHADAVKEALAPLKERDKLESQIEDLKGQIAKLEEKAAGSPNLLYALSDAEISKLAKLREDLHVSRETLARLKSEIEDKPRSLLDIVMDAAAVQRQMDVFRALTDALVLGKRIVPKGTKVDVGVVADMIHVGLDGTRYLLDASSDPRTGEIALALHALDPAARIGHEGVHTLVTLGHISPEELAMLAKASRDAKVFKAEWSVAGERFDDFEAAKLHADANGIAHDDIIPYGEARYRKAYKDRANLEAIIEEEAAAHLIEAVVAGKVKVNLPATLLDHIKALIERIRSYLNGAGFHTPEDVIHAIVSGEAARRTAREAWMRKQDYSAVAVKDVVQPDALAALADGDALTIADKIANIESASAALERLPRNGRRPLNDAYDLITSPSVGRAIYYVVLKGKPLEDRHGNIKAVGRFDVKPAQRIDVAGVEVTNARVDERHQRKGIASAAYEAIANDMADVGGLSPSPRDQLSPDAQSFWGKRLGHQMFALADAETGRSMRRDLDALGYYSQALEAAKSLKQAKGTPEQMLAMLKAAGARDAEIEATGLGEFLKAKAARPEPDGLQPQGQGNEVSRVLAETPEYKRAEAAAVKAFNDDLDENATTYFDRHVEHDDNGDRLPLDAYYPSLYRSDWASILPATVRAVEAGASALGYNFAMSRGNTGSQYGTITVNGAKKKVRVADHEMQSRLHDGADFNISPNSMTPMQFFEALVRLVQTKPRRKAQTAVTRGEIVDYLTRNRVGLNERVYADTNAVERRALREQLREARRSSEPNFQRIAELESRLSDIGMDDTDKPRWQNYSLDPSNPSYRETVLHLPVERRMQFSDYLAAYRDRFPKSDVSDAEVRSFYDKGIEVPGAGKTVTQKPDVMFNSGHFPAPNIIGHMMTSIVKHDGKPVYLIDQIQSDWGQKLRDGGVRDEAKIAGLEAKYRAAQEKLDTFEAEVRAKGARVTTFRDVAGDYPYARLQSEVDRTHAEWQLAKELPSGHPLVNTTDQWVNTTLRRAIRQAVEADADFIAIPHGDTVLSYNPGDTDGMRGFYGSRTSDGIVPKNLRKLLAKIDKDSPHPVKVEALDTPGKGAAGKGFTLFPLTAKVKASVLNHGQAMFAFAGERAKTADLDALSRARQMETDGTSREDIWTETGWFKGVDGKWRFEIDDSGMSTVRGGFTDAIMSGGRSSLGSVYSHQGMYGAYPQIDSMPVRFQPGRPSSYSATSKSIVLGKPDKSTALHEATHGVQDIEGFAQGANLDIARRTPEYAAAMNAMRRAPPDNGWTSVSAHTPETVADGIYRMFAGEVEARTVQKRMDLTPEQRLSRPPWLDYDVPEDQQIVRFADGKSVSQMSYGSEPPVEGPAMRGLKMFAIRAFHGSPHDFDRFDIGKIGTGEGAQAFGYGLYFAESEGVAKSYKDNLARRDYSLDGKPLNPSGPVEGDIQYALWQTQGDIDAAIKWMQREAQHGPPGMDERFAPAIALAEQWKNAGRYSSNSSGKMYEVRINAEPDQFLDWDKPLSQQSESVRRALETAGIKANPRAGTDEAVARLKQQAADDPMNKAHYNKAIDRLMSEGAADPYGRELLQRVKEDRLREAGIPGIKYLDAGSRVASEGTRNYVIFDDSLIEIVAKDGKPIGKGERQSVVDGMSGRRQDDGKMFAMGNEAPSPRPPLHAEMAMIDKLDRLRELAEACR